MNSFKLSVQEVKEHVITLHLQIKEDGSIHAWIGHNSINSPLYSQACAGVHAGLYSFSPTATEGQALSPTKFTSCMLTCLKIIQKNINFICKLCTQPPYCIEADECYGQLDLRLYLTYISSNVCMQA